eukprot:4742368-Prymnesium_polylepis.1
MKFSERHPSYPVARSAPCDQTRCRHKKTADGTDGREERSAPTNTRTTQNKRDRTRNHKDHTGGTQHKPQRPTTQATQSHETQHQRKDTDTVTQTGSSPMAPPTLTAKVTRRKDGECWGGSTLTPDPPERWLGQPSGSDVGTPDPWKDGPLKGSSVTPA